MSELNFHNARSSMPPPNEVLPVVQKLLKTYKLWHGYLPHFGKDSRYTAGYKIDSLFLETIEPILIASKLNRIQKTPYIQKAISKLDLLKFFLLLSWEIKALDDKKYIILSENISEIGRMLGSWLKQLNKQTP